MQDWEEPETLPTYDLLAPALSNKDLTNNEAKTKSSHILKVNEVSDISLGCF